MTLETCILWRSDVKVDNIVVAFYNGNNGYIEIWLMENYFD